MSKSCVLQVLHHDVLMRDQAIDAVVPPLPPVLRRSVIEKQRGSFLEGQLPGSASSVIKLSDGLDLFDLCKHSGQIHSSPCIVSAYGVNPSDDAADIDFKLWRKVDFKFYVLLKKHFKWIIE